MPEFIHPGVFVAIVAAPGASIAEALVEHAERMHYRFAAATPAAASSRHPPTNLKGVLGLETTSSEHGVEALSTRGINPLRARADGDVRVWGARTLSSDPEWKYVNIRLLFEPRVILSSVPYQLFR